MLNERTQDPEENAAVRSAIACPRCGYDLRGIVATWEDACPLEGRCSECGLTIDWPRLFQEAEHGWLFEYHWRRMPLKSLGCTVRAAFNPFRFWRQADLYDRVRIWPIVLMLFLPSLVLAVFRYLTIFWYAWDEWCNGSNYIRWRIVNFSGALPGNPSSAPWADITVASLRSWAPDPAFLYMVLLPAAAAIVLWPITFLIAPATLRAARVRLVHIARIAAYSAVAPLYVLALWSLLSLPLAITNLEELALFPKLYRWTRAMRGLYFTDAIYDLKPWAPVAAFVFGLWGLLWWAAGCHMYLRIAYWPRLLIGLSLIVALLLALQIVIPLAWLIQ